MTAKKSHVSKICQVEFGLEELGYFLQLSDLYLTQVLGSFSSYFFFLVSHAGQNNFTVVDTAFL